MNGAGAHAPGLGAGAVPLSPLAALEGDFDACVIGAGPAGLACAFDLSDKGWRVLLLEAGGETPIPGEPDIRAAEILHPAFHDPIDIVAASALGGSTHWWGGRCVPFDDADFTHWPLAQAELAPWLEKAAGFLGGRAIHESQAPGSFAALKAFDAMRDETWGPEINMARRWRTRIRAANGPDIVLGARVLSLTHSDGRVNTLRVRTGAGDHVVRTPRIVLACGGLGVLKLLLLLQRDAPNLFGAAPLGRGYMGHLTGSIAALRPSDPQNVRAFACRPLGDGAYGRRRFRPSAETIGREDIVNIAFWLENSDANNPEHGSATASARYLATRLLRFGRGADPIEPHIANVARAPWSAFTGLTSAAYLLAAARLMGRHPRTTTLTPARAGEWRLDYHAEQRCDWNNRISLAETLDSTGQPKLKIDFRIGESDIEAVVRAHDLLDADLRAAGAGELIMSDDRQERVARVRAAARDGYHQIGGAIMGHDQQASIVDTNLKVHALENVWVASSSVFPSGGQANPTLMIVALARRLASHLHGGA